jgi:tellurite resistance protein TehA-like permease
MDDPNELKRYFSITDPAGDERDTSSPPPRPTTKYDVGWRRVVRNFSPSWFSVTMGTGIVALLLITIPWKARWLYWLSIVFFGLNTILFFMAFTISILRYTLYPEIWSVMIDSTNALFLGTIPMGFATLVEMWIFVCVPAWGPWAVTFAWVCWIIDSAVAALVTLSLSILLISHSNQQSLDRITAAQLLPIAATIVAAGAGAEIAEVLPNPEHALGTLITSYVMWGMSVPLAMAVLVMYYQRLALHKLPPREVVVSCFLPLGPLGMGGYTIMYLGKVSRIIFPQTHFFHNLAVAGDVIYIIGIFVALIMWGFGLVWLVFALCTIYLCRPFPFNMGWWGFTFPLGVFSISTITFGVEMPSLFFRVLGTILSVAVVILWIVVAVGTAKGAFSGELFFAPCLANLKDNYRLPPVEKDEGGSENAR